MWNLKFHNCVHKSLPLVPEPEEIISAVTLFMMLLMLIFPLRFSDYMLCEHFNPPLHYCAF